MTDQGKAMGNEGPIEWTRPVYGDEWQLRARLKGQPDSFSRDVNEADLAAAGFVPKAELEAYDRAISEFDAWLGEQAAFFVQNPQVNRTFLDVAAKLMHTLRTVPVKPTPEPGEPVGGKLRALRDRLAKEGGERNGSQEAWSIACELSEILGDPLPGRAVDSSIEDSQGNVGAANKIASPLAPPVPAETAGLPDVVMWCDAGRSQVLELQSALTRAEGRVRELEAAREHLLDSELRYATASTLNGKPLGSSSAGWTIRTLIDSGYLRAQPPLASSVVADEATTGEAEQSAILDALDAADDAARARQEAALGAVDEATTGEPIEYAIKVSPITGEEGKAERVESGGPAAWGVIEEDGAFWCVDTTDDDVPGVGPYLTRGEALARCEQLMATPMNYLHEARRAFEDGSDGTRMALHFVIRHLESRAAKGGSDGR